MIFTFFSLKYPLSFVSSRTLYNKEFNMQLKKKKRTERVQVCVLWVKHNLGGSNSNKERKKKKRNKPADKRITDEQE